MKERGRLDRDVAHGGFGVRCQRSAWNSPHTFNGRLPPP
jgi:hypothetical protein